MRFAILGLLLSLSSPCFGEDGFFITSDPNTEELIRVHFDGSFLILGDPGHGRLECFAWNSDTETLFAFILGSPSELVSIDLDTLDVTVVRAYDTSVQFRDMTYAIGDGNLYATGPRLIYQINPETGEITDVITRPDYATAADSTSAVSGITYLASPGPLVEQIGFGDRGLWAMWGNGMFLFEPSWQLYPVSTPISSGHFYYRYLAFVPDAPSQCTDNRVARLWGDPGDWQIDFFRENAPPPALAACPIVLPPREAYRGLEYVPGGCANGADSEPPQVQHGETGASATHPFTGYVDPRAESTNGEAIDLGLTDITFEFSEPVLAVGGEALSSSSFTVTSTGGRPPVVESVDDSENPLVRITLDTPPPLNEWTTITAIVEDLCGNPIESLGNLGPGVEEPDRIDFLFLPGDVDQNGEVGPFDLLRFRQIVNEIVVPTHGTPEDYVDTNRTGEITPFDLLMYRQLVTGTVPATRVWNGETANNPQP